MVPPANRETARSRGPIAPGIKSQAIAWCGFLFDIGYQTRGDCPMPRQLRIEYHGAIYHVVSRGDRREKIFLDDVDRQDFLKTLTETC